jgi:DNA-binding FadR family transcriptional regulator
MLTSMAGSHRGVVKAASEDVDVASPRKIRAADKALTHLHRLIDLRRVLPGELLPSAASISAEIGVNRMAVLQAFQMLQSDGLIHVRPGRGGARVVGRDERPQSQRLARATGSTVLAELAMVVRWMFMVVLDAVELDRERLQHANEEHAKILSAIVRRSPGAAADWAHRHAASSMQLIEAELGWHDGNGTHATERTNGQGDSR